MVHTIKRVAEANNLELDAFIAFCYELGEEYGAFVEGNNMVVSTWFVGSLIEGALAHGVRRLTREEIIASAIKAQ